MTRKFSKLTVATLLCLSVSLVYGQGRGKKEEGKKPAGESKPERKPEGKPAGEKPAGAGKSERKPEEKPAHERTGNEPAGKPEKKEVARSAENSPGGAWSERTHGGKQSGEQPTASGAAGAAAGEAAAKNKTPNVSGAEGAAAGAAASKRNAPAVSGAAGAAAGEAAAKNKAPQATGAEGAAAGVAAAKRNSSQVSGAKGAAAGAAVAERNSPKAGGAAGYATVRRSFDQPNMYGRQWYSDHPHVWIPTGWSAGAAWAPASWDAVSGHCGYANVTPVSYHYGENVNYEDGNVLVDGTAVGTAAEFSQQAAALAEKGAAANVSDTDEWLPLGVFALVRNEHQHPQLILQLAINPQGIIRGNYTDEVTGHTLPIQGAVDEKTQRAAWTVGGNSQSVMEAGLNNLTENEAPALNHRNGKTDHWLLIRLEQQPPAQ